MNEPKACGGLEGRSGTRVGREGGRQKASQRARQPAVLAQLGASKPLNELLRGGKGWIFSEGGAKEGAAGKAAAAACTGYRACGKH